MAVDTNDGHFEARSSAVTLSISKSIHSPLNTNKPAPALSEPPTDYTGELDHARNAEMGRNSMIIILSFADVI